MQSWKPGVHPQLPNVQTPPLGQRLPQLPQLLRSTCVETQPSGQAVSPAVHERQLPPIQVPRQKFPQLPQLSWLSTEMQMPPQSWKPGVQLQLPKVQTPPLAQRWPQLPQLERSTLSETH